MKLLKTITTFFLVIFLSQNLFSQEPKIYFSVLARKISTVVGQDINVNGLYVGNKDNNLWERMCWKNSAVFGITVDKKSNGKNIFLACGNGVMRSTDYGKNWKILTSWEVTEVMKVCINPENSNILYLCSSFGIWKSTDYGDTWIKKITGLKLVNQTYNICMAILPSSPNILFSGTADGIVQSMDGGENWTTLALKGAEVHDIEICPYDEKCIVCTTEDEGIYISRNGGKTWKQINNGLKNTTFYTIAVDPINKGTFYCGGHQTGIYKTTDFGEKWIQLNNEITGKIIHSIAVYPNDPNMVFAGALDYGIYKSNDGGITFSCVGESDGKIWHVVIQ